MIGTLMDTSIQAQFISSLVRNKSLIAIYLRHGIKLSGVLVGFHKKVLFLKDSNGIQMIYMDSVSTVIEVGVTSPVVASQ